MLFLKLIPFSQQTNDYETPLRNLSSLPNNQVISRCFHDFFCHRLKFVDSYAKNSHPTSCVRNQSHLVAHGGFLHFHRHRHRATTSQA